MKDFLNQNPRVHFVDSRVFFSCFTKIRSWLDLDLLAAYLFKYGVVKNGGDFNALTSPYLTSQVKMNSLINLLEKAGTEGFMFLYMCLSESSDESLGHKDAVQELDHGMSLIHYYSIFFCIGRYVGGEGGHQLFRYLLTIQPHCHVLECCMQSMGSFWYLVLLLSLKFYATSHQALLHHLN